MSVQDRTTFCNRRGLCFGSFSVRHVTRDCHAKKSCGINSCKLTHHCLLHADTVIARPHSGIARTARRTVAFGVIQQDALAADGRKVPVNMMLDGGSDSTIFHEGFVRRLGLHGRRQVLKIAWKMVDAMAAYIQILSIREAANSNCLQWDRGC